MKNNRPSRTPPPSRVYPKAAQFQLNDHAIRAANNKQNKANIENIAASFLLNLPIL